MPSLIEKKEGINMKKIIVTATALMFALGLTVTAHAQGAAEKSKTSPAQVQKVTTQEMAQQKAKTETPKTAPAEGKKIEPTVTGKKDKEKAAAHKDTAKDVKTTAMEGKKPVPEATKTGKQ
jgi:hypothetical protein